MRKVAEGDRCAGIQHPFELTVRHPEGRCGVGYVVELLTVGADYAQGVAALVESRRARGLLNPEFFERLMRWRPDRDADIFAIARAFGVGA